MQRTIVLWAAVILVGACAASPPLVVEVESLLAAGEVASATGRLDRARICVDGGTGVMGTDDGSTDERPPHDVTLDPFCIGRYEVTNAQYAGFIAATASRAPGYWAANHPPPDATLQPVTGVSWDDADAYCRWAGGRLPTEAEWERACRGPEGRRFPWGNEWNADHVQITAVALDHPDEGWPGALGEPLAGGAVLPHIGTTPAGATPAGVYGLADGVMEWVADWYDADAYATLPSTNPLAAGPTWNHVVRGSAWLFPFDRPDDVPDLARCTARNSSHVIASARIGFRCAFDP
jgi:iron(II)-dependent oxidoreductase